MASTKHAVTLLGAGTQGRRLAYMWSRQGRPVFLLDQNKQQLVNARSEIDKFRGASECSSSHNWGEIITGDPEELSIASSKSWLVLECVPEMLPLKKKIVQNLDKVAPKETIVASNSSSYTINEIMDGVEITNPERCISLHSYWPPETSAIEIMGTNMTREDIVPRLMKETRDHGFSPFHVRTTSIGYIYNRIWAAIKREALLALSEGVATPQEIDAIFKDVLKTPKGPCEQMDVVGLDVVHDIEQHYADVRSGIPEEPRTLLREMIKQQKLGIKSGAGFYDYKS